MLALTAVLFASGATSAFPHPEDPEHPHLRPLQSRRAPETAHDSSGTQARRPWFKRLIVRLVHLNRSAEPTLPSTTARAPTPLLPRPLSPEPVRREQPIRAEPIVGAEPIIAPERAEADLPISATTLMPTTRRRGMNPFLKALLVMGGSAGGTYAATVALGMEQLHALCMTGLITLGVACYPSLIPEKPPGPLE